MPTALLSSAALRWASVMFAQPGMDSGLATQLMLQPLCSASVPMVHVQGMASPFATCEGTSRLTQAGADTGVAMTMFEYFPGVSSSPSFCILRALM